MHLKDHSQDISRRWLLEWEVPQCHRSRIEGSASDAGTVLGHLVHFLLLDDLERF